MEKYDIVNGLAREFGLRRYLEICTPTTGKKFQYVDAEHFDVCHRLIYRCHADHDDGFETTRRTADDTSHALVTELHGTLPAAERYDIVLVDPHHTYRASRLDLLGAMCLLAPHGVMVVHDCNPTDAGIVQPQFQDGSWCGVTYQAYVDFVLGGRAAGHCTVDADYGCGVVYNAQSVIPPAWRGARAPDRMALDWAAASDDDEARFAFFDQHRTVLLNLVTPAHFQAVHPLCRSHRAATPATVEGSNAFTVESDLHLLADGMRIAPFAAEPQAWKFHLPAGTRSVRVVSRAITPAMLNDANDSRMLGICLHAVEINSTTGEHLHRIAPDDTGFREGIHPVERAGEQVWRWTSGSALLPALPAPSVPTVLTLRGRQLPRYPVTES